ncbi:hypothetical protein ACROYT_G022851 [Oculina patagonica]
MMAALWLAKFALVTLTIYLVVVFVVAKTDFCGSVFEAQIDHALVGHAIGKARVVADEFECQLSCLGNIKCKSFNVHFNNGKSANRPFCELNNKTRQTKPGDFKCKKGSTYYGSVQVSCIDVSRNRNGKTVKSGKCHPGYNGKQCEKRRPKVSLSRGPSYVGTNKNVTLPTCHVTSFPPAVITWSKVHGQLLQGRAASKDGKLSIMNAQKNDSGLYKCKASNSLGKDSAVTQLVVVELPQFTVSPPVQLKEFTNQNITVPCQATGDPKPTITWMKENGQLPSGRSKVSEDGTLQIWNAKEEDSGIYTCTASSAVMFKASSAKMKLTVSTGVCGPVGVEDRNIIPDERMTASTVYDSRYYPYYGRLNGSRGAGAWCPNTKFDRTDYLQVDMGAVSSVCAVATQGANGANEWTTSYKLRLSRNEVTWHTYKENNVEKVFSGNSDRNSIVKHSLSTDVKARFVRFYPVTYNSWSTLRVEIFVL